MALADAGMIVSSPLIADGTLHRCYVDGDKSGTKNGAYILHLDGKPAGWAYHFSTGATVNWSANGKRQRMTETMRRMIANEKAKRQLESVQCQHDAADKAKFVWSRGTPILYRTHPYLIKKQIDPYGLRLSRDNVLMVPMFDGRNKLVNLQFIDAAGNKRFLSGGRKKGCFAVIGKYQSGKPILICEGWATGASLHQHYGLFVVVALDAGNLEPVAVNIRKRAPHAEIIIMGDNDVSGVGQTFARKAALALRGKYKIPSTPGNDWNDELNAMPINKEAIKGYAND